MTRKAIDRIPLRQFSGPRYWPTWLALGIMWLLAHLPFRLQMRIGQLLGWLSYFFASERRDISKVNLALCFPELDERSRRKLLVAAFLSNGMGAMEVAMSWCRNPEDFRSRVEVTGLEYLQAARAQGRGVLLLCCHFSTLEFGGSLFTLFEEMDVTYRENRNPLFNAVMTNGRKRHYPNVIERKNVRDIYRSLKQGHILWYAPDQDYGPKLSVFVPFFGVEAATITAASRLAAANNSVVIFYRHYRRPDNAGYLLDFSPPVDNYPSGDDVADAIRINGIIEQAIRKHPEQYLWMHKRFKTQRAGKAARPYKNYKDQ